MELSAGRVFGTDPPCRCHGGRGGMSRLGLPMADATQITLPIHRDIRTGEGVWYTIRATTGGVAFEDRASFDCGRRYDTGSSGVVRITVRSATSPPGTLAYYVLAPTAARSRSRREIVTTPLGSTVITSWQPGDVCHRNRSISHGSYARSRAPADRSMSSVTRSRSSYSPNAARDDRAFLTRFTAARGSVSSSGRRRDEPQPPSSPSDFGA